MTGTVTWEVLFLMGGVVVCTIGAVIWVMREFGKRDIDLEKYKTHAAENFATKSGVADSMKAVHDALEKLTGRIDRFLDRSER